MSGRGHVALALLIAAGCRRAPEAPFVDVTATSGLDGAVPSYDAALADFDGDGLVDVYLGNHGAGAALYRNLGHGRFENVIGAAGIEPGGDQHGAGWGDADGDGRPDLYVGLGAERGRGSKANRLYQNVGGRFVDATDADTADPRGRARGVTWVDYDRDGRLDIFVANYASPNVLLHNRGDGRFEDRAAAAGLARPGAVRAVWTDYDHDGWPDVLFAATPGGIRLLHNERDGTFRDATDAAGLPRWPPAQGAAFGDADGDGTLDLVLAAGTDFPVSVTLRDGIATFAITGGKDVGVALEAGESAPPMVLFREGAPLADGPALRSAGPGRWLLQWPGPGRLAGRIGPGVRVASLVGTRPWRARRAHRLYLNRGDGTFAEARGALAGRGNGQAVAWADVDDDGDLDLYVVQSGVEDADEPDALYLNDGHGGFTRPAAIAPTDGRGCGAHFADLDGDGRLDLLLTAGWGVPPLARGRPRLLRNVARDPGHWLEVELVGRRSNRPGLGAWVEVTAGGRRQVRFHAGGSLYSQSLLPEHFGLGAASEARIAVAWPSGVVQTVDTPADRRLRLVEAEP